MIARHSTSPRAWSAMPVLSRSIVGALADASKFDRGTAVYGQALTARELRSRLGIQ